MPRETTVPARMPDLADNPVSPTVPAPAQRQTVPRQTVPAPAPRQTTPRQTVPASAPAQVSSTTAWWIAAGVIIVALAVAAGILVGLSLAQRDGQDLPGGTHSRPASPAG
ncbi:hypothetical protein ACFPIJ_37855 [Dactylosporangium cerinum]|uniref:Uncharacterized protein n=1 Tax=Dactylosporangium cerinum TaxID=1434730 RepID=A0ABV9W6M5_9ACTN